MSPYFDQILNHIPYFYQKSHPTANATSDLGIFNQINAEKQNTPSVKSDVFASNNAINSRLNESQKFDPKALFASSPRSSSIGKLGIHPFSNDVQTQFAKASNATPKKTEMVSGTPEQPQTFLTGDPSLEKTAQAILYPQNAGVSTVGQPYLSVGFDSGLKKEMATPHVDLRPWVEATPAPWQKTLARQKADGIVLEGIEHTITDPEAKYLYTLLQQGNLSELYSPDTVSEVIRAVEYDRSNEDSPMNIYLKTFLDGVKSAAVLGTVSLPFMDNDPLAMARTFGAVDFGVYKKPLERYKKHHPDHINPTAYPVPYDIPYATGENFKESMQERTFRDLSDEQKGFLVRRIMEQTPGKFSDALNAYLLGLSSNDPHVRPMTPQHLDKEPQWYETMLNQGTLPNPPKTPEEYLQAMTLMDLKNQYEQKMNREIRQNNKKSLFARLPIDYLRQTMNTPDYYSTIDINVSDIGNRPYTPAEEAEINRSFYERDRSRFRQAIRDILKTHGYDPARMDDIPDHALRQAFEQYQQKRNNYLNDVLDPTLSYTERLKRNFIGQEHY